MIKTTSKTESWFERKVIWNLEFNLNSVRLNNKMTLVAGHSLFSSPCKKIESPWSHDCKIKALGGHATSSTRMPYKNCVSLESLPAPVFFLAHRSAYPNLAQTIKIKLYGLSFRSHQQPAHLSSSAPLFSGTRGQGARGLHGCHALRRAGACDARANAAAHCRPWWSTFLRWRAASMLHNAQTTKLAVVATR